MAKAIGALRHRTSEGGENEKTGPAPWEGKAATSPIRNAVYANSVAATWGAKLGTREEGRAPAWEACGGPAI